VSFHFSAIVWASKLGNFFNVMPPQSIDHQASERANIT